MASKENIPDRKRALVAELGALRAQLGANRSALSRQLNPVRGLYARLGSHPLKSFGLTFLATGLLTMLLRRKPKTKPKKAAKARATMKGFFASTLLGASQPILKRWIIYMVKQKYGSRFNPPSRDSLLGE